jgi:DNA-binding transcriptional ArsR family regulator
MLAAPRRFDLLLLMLAGGDRSVSQLAEAVGLSQSCTTRHLQALARAGLVKGARDGKRVVFRIAPHDEAARSVLASVAGGGALPAVASAREAMNEHKRRPRRQPAERRDHQASRKLLETAVRIESTAEHEPFMAEEPSEAPVPSQRADPESGRTSEPETAPAWRRSDLEDFLL